MKKNIIKRFMIALMNFALSVSVAVVLAAETMRVNFSLLINRICRADLAERISRYGHSSSFDEDYNLLMSELEAIKSSGLYPKLLVESDPLVKVLILIIVFAVIAGLFWLSWQNFQALILVYRETLKGYRDTLS